MMKIVEKWLTCARIQRERGRQKKYHIKEKMKWIDTDKPDAGILMLFYYDAMFLSKWMTNHRSKRDHI